MDRSALSALLVGVVAGCGSPSLITLSWPDEFASAELIFSVRTRQTEVRQIAGPFDLDRMAHLQLDPDETMYLVGLDSATVSDLLMPTTATADELRLEAKDIDTCLDGQISSEGRLELPVPKTAAIFELDETRAHFAPGSIEGLGLLISQPLDPKGCEPSFQERIRAVGNTPRLFSDGDSILGASRSIADNPGYFLVRRIAPIDADRLVVTTLHGVFLIHRGQPYEDIPGVTALGSAQLGPSFPQGSTLAGVAGARFVDGRVLVVVELNPPAAELLSVEVSDSGFGAIRGLQTVPDIAPLNLYAGPRGELVIPADDGHVLSSTSASATLRQTRPASNSIRSVAFLDDSMRPHAVGVNTGEVRIGDILEGQFDSAHSWQLAAGRRISGLGFDPNGGSDPTLWAAGDAPFLFRHRLGDAEWENLPWHAPPAAQICQSHAASECGFRDLVKVEGLALHAESGRVFAHASQCPQIYVLNQKRKCASYLDTPITHNEISEILLSGNTLYIAGYEGFLLSMDVSD